MPKFSCFVIGDGVVTLKCLQILAQAGHLVLGVYSTDGSLQAWADEQGVDHARSRKIFRDLLLTSEYDYLFSINNGWIIPPEIIARAHQATINYHNSPLPKYAGLYASSWALLNGETQHAITWHEVVPEIDAGRIFKQPIVQIKQDDTVLSLNTRCIEVAVTAFEELVQELAENRAELFAQDLSNRSYFGMSDRPKAACLLSFDEYTKTLCDLIRALDFAPTRNPIGLPKLWLPGGVVAVSQAQPIAITYGSPGQVLALDENGLCVATVDSAILLNRITTLEGIPLTPDVLSDRYGVCIGAVLPVLNPEIRNAISEHNAAICRHEHVWVEHLAHLAPFVHPFLQLETHPIQNNKEYRYSISLPCAVNARSLLALFAAYCARLSTEAQCDVALQTDAQRSIASEIFAQSVPVHIQAKDNESVTQFGERFETALTRASRLGSYTLDIVARHS